MNQSSSLRQRPQRLRERVKETVRAAILESAEEVFAEDGIHRARMEEIAAHAGVSVGTLYNYFDDRQALLSALLATRRQELIAKVDQFLDESAQAPFRSRLEGFLKLVVEHFQSHIRLFSILVEDELECGRLKTVSGPRSMMRELGLRAEKLVRAGVEEGALRAEDAGLYPAFLLGMMRGVLARHLADKQGPPVGEVGEPLARLFVEGAGTGRERK